MSRPMFIAAAIAIMLAVSACGTGSNTRSAAPVTGTDRNEMSKSPCACGPLVVQPNEQRT